MFQTLQCVVVDEWHELLGTKRGVQTELALARLREAQGKSLRIWGLSATLGNLNEAMGVLLGNRAESGRHVRGAFQKRVEVKTLIPENMERFPWSGHLGIKLLPAVIRQIEQAKTTLVFTNTRSQTEIWYQSILGEKPSWAGQLAAHHGSIERDLRDAVERDLDSGKLKAVVCTSSLDLGVDFTPVEQVIQIGSPKGVARLMQRAGRSGHQPGATSRIYGVPTNALELIEFAAAREAMERGEIESRIPIRRPLDVLVQHLVTCGLGGGFEEQALQEEIQSTYAFSNLDAADWSWALDFAARGGKALKAYPQFARLLEDEDRFLMQDRRLSQQHRMSIGTITSDTEVTVKLQRGGTLGRIEETFVSRLKPGDVFNFAGRKVELVRFRSMTATVKLATRRKGAVPSWQGGRSPLSTELALAVWRKLDPVGSRVDPDPEMLAAQPILRIQSEWSALPDRGQLLVESTHTRTGFHVSFFPFGGRLVHEGLATLAAFRLSREQPISIRVTPNDYGFSIQTPESFELSVALVRRLLTGDGLLEDLLECLNATELARRQFREISRVAGLVMQGFPGREKSQRQLQVSSGLLFDVFSKYEPDNLLVEQARREILERQLELTRLSALIERIASLEVLLKETRRLTPLAFPLWADQLGESLSSESRTDRIQKMVASLEEEAGFKPDLKSS